MDDETTTTDDAFETKLINRGKAVSVFFPHFSYLRNVRVPRCRNPSGLRQQPDCTVLGFACLRNGAT